MVPAPKQRNTEAEKAAIRQGRVPEGWTPAKVRQKDRDARWSIKYSKAKLREGAVPGQQSRSISPSRCSATRTISASTRRMA